MKPASHLGLPQKERFESDLHDLTNVLSAARSYADVLLLRARSGTPADPGVVEALLREFEHLNEIVKNVRNETYTRGDVLKCGGCGYTWVHRKSIGKRALCRRCNGVDVERWKPSDPV